MKYKEIVTIQGYNLYETLNVTSNTVNPLNKVSKLKIPTKIIHVERNGNNKTIITYLIKDGKYHSEFIMQAQIAEPSLKS